MRILYVHSFSLDNSLSGHYVKNLAQALGEGGHEVAILAPGQQGVVSSCQTFELRLPSIPSFDILGRGKSAAYSSMSTASLLELYQLWLYQAIDVVKDFEPDIIHVQHACVGAWATNFISAMTGIPFVITAHGGGVRLARNDRRFINLTRDALLNAQAVITLSESVRQSLAPSFSVTPNERFKVIPGGVDLEKSLPKAAEDHVSTRLGVEGAYAVLPLGQVTGTMIPFLSALGKGTDATVVLLGGVGDADLLSPLQEVPNLRICSDLPLADQFALIESSTVFVSSSVYPNQIEPFTVEALCYGKPLVLCQTGTVPGVWKDDSNARFVAMNDGGAVAQALNELMGDEELRILMGEASRELARDRFSTASAADAVLRLAYQVPRSNGAHER